MAVKIGSTNINTIKLGSTNISSAYLGSTQVFGGSGGGGGSSSSGWTQLGSDIDGEAEEDIFGWASAMSSDGSIVAIGGVLNDGNGSSSGHVRVYEYSSGSWTQLGSDIDGENAGD